MFRRREGGVLKALGLLDWYRSLGPDRRERVRRYFSVKVMKDMRFPYRAADLDRGEVSRVHYTRRTFLATLAQTAFLEGDLETAEWLYNEALKQEGTPYEAHLIYSDLIVLAQRLRDTSKLKRYCEEDVKLYPQYRRELHERERSPRLVSFEVYVNLLEREGRVREALSLLEFISKEGVAYPYYEEVRKRLISGIRDEGDKQGS